MPKRIGYLYEMVIDRDNILAAIAEMTKNKKNHRGAIVISGYCVSATALIFDQLG